MKLRQTIPALVFLAGVAGAYGAPGLESKATLSIDCQQRERMHAPAARAVSTELPAYAGGEAPHFITSVPETAEKQLYSRDWKGFWVFNYLFSAIMQGEENERVQYLYFDGDDVYLPTPVLSFEAPSYIKGKKTADGITFPLPQCVYSYDDTENGEKVRKDFYIDFLYWDLDFNNYYTADVAEEHSFDLTLEADGTYRWINEEIVSGPDPDNPEVTLRFMKRILGIVNQDDVWAGYADYKTVMTPFTTPLVEVPEDVFYTLVTLRSGEVERTVKVAFKDSEVWIQGFSEENPESWVKGNLYKGIATFGRQYVGIDADSYYFGTFSGCTSEMGYNEILEQPELIVHPLDLARFEYDPENYTFTAVTDVMIGGGQDCEYTIEFLEMPVLTGRAQTLRPATPVIDSWYNFNRDFGYGRMTFSAPAISETGSQLDPEKLSWSFEIDGNMYEWDPSVHKKLTEPMTWIPYDFSDGNDIKIEGDKRSGFFRKTVEYYLAVRLRYEKSEGDYLESNYVLATTDAFKLEDWPGLNEPPLGDDEGGQPWPDPQEPEPEHDSVENIVGTDKEIVSVQYFDLSGRLLQTAPERGIYLKKVLKSDGSAKTLKIAR